MSFIRDFLNSTGRQIIFVVVTFIKNALFIVVFYFSFYLIKLCNSYLGIDTIDDFTKRILDFLHNLGAFALFFILMIFDVYRMIKSSKDGDL